MQLPSVLSCGGIRYVCVGPHVRHMATWLLLHTVCDVIACSQAGAEQGATGTTCLRACCLGSPHGLWLAGWQWQHGPLHAPVHSVIRSSMRAHDRDGLNWIQIHDRDERIAGAREASLTSSQATAVANRLCTVQHPCHPAALLRPLTVSE